MFKQLLTLVRGQTTDSSQAMLDANALPLLRQQMRDAARGVALFCDFDATRRTLRMVDDEALFELGQREELCGREVEVLADGVRWR